MKKIIYLFFAFILLTCLSGCDFFDKLFPKDKSIKICYDIGEDKYYKTYDDYTEVVFDTVTTTTGYEFAGWSFTKSGSVITKDDLKGKSSVTLYPIINPINYKITYILDGGVNNPTNPATYTILDNITLKAPTKEGYAFAGWVVDDNEAVIDYKINEGSYGNITLTATYTTGKVNVYFEYDGIATQTIDYNSLCTKPTDPIKLGDTFLYWCIDDSLETEFDFNTPVTHDITLYPRFKNTKFYTVTINNVDLINSNRNNGDKLPSDAVITLSTDYLIDGFAFTGWDVDGYILSKNYKVEIVMPSRDVEITPLFEAITLYSYTVGKNSNLNINISKESSGALYGENISSTDYTSTATTLSISYKFLDTLPLGIHAFVYENSKIINVNVKAEGKTVTNINIDYDINYPNATPTFNEIEGYTYSYSIDGSTYKECHSGEVFSITNKLTEHQLDIKCDDKITNYVIEELPAQSINYINETFTYQGNTYDHYVDSLEDLQMILEYYSLAKYPSVGGSSYKFNFYYPNGNDENVAKASYEHIIKDIMSIPYDLSYTFYYAKEVEFTLKSSGKFNTLTTSQVREDITTTHFDGGARSSDFDDFYIENCTVTQEVRSIYELEALNVGIKPIIKDSKAQTLYNKAKEILRQYVDSDMTEFEKAKAIYDYLGSYVTYDDALLSIPNNRSQYASFTSYAALINGVAVCDGIASAFKLLCTIEGIECIEVVGAAKGGGHAWNKIKVGNVWYGVDATWSRTNFEGKGTYITHTYFLIDELTLINYGDSRHFEQAEVDQYGIVSGMNINYTANNYINYFDYFMYGNYDLVCTSQIEFTEMLAIFKANNINFIEIELRGITKDQISVYGSYYSVYKVSNTRITLIH